MTTTAQPEARIQVDIPEDIPEVPGSTGTTGADYICESCGAVRSSQSALNVHIEAEHPKKRTRASGQSDNPAADAGGSTTRRPRVKTEKRQIEDLKKSILEDFNPFMITTLSQTGIPIGMMDGTLPTGRTVRQELEFGETQAEIIARGIVKMQGTPVVSMATNMVGPFIPYAFGILALIVVGMQTMKVWMIRSEISKQLQLSLNQGSDGNSAQYV